LFFPLKNPVPAGRHFATIGALIAGVVVAIITGLAPFPHKTIAAVCEDAVVQAGVGLIVITIITGLFTPPQNTIATPGLETAIGAVILIVLIAVITGFPLIRSTIATALLTAGWITTVSRHVIAVIAGFKTLFVGP